MCSGDGLHTASLPPSLATFTAVLCKKLNFSCCVMYDDVIYYTQYIAISAVYFLLCTCQREACPHPTPKHMWLWYKQFFPTSFWLYTCNIYRSFGRGFCQWEADVIGMLTDKLFSLMTHIGRCITVYVWYIT